MTSLGREIAQQVPFMRRFARASTGSQSLGDLCVKQCLERLLASGSQPALDTLRLDLFQVLNDVLGDGADDRGLRRNAAIDELAAGPSLAATGSPIGDRSILVRRMGELDPESRRLLLLTSLERFTLSQAAHILRREPDETARLLDEAKAALREQRATRILVIEDEPYIALDIKTTCERHGHAVVGVATTHAEAVQMAHDAQPGLVLADIQLADQSSGLAAVQEILREIVVPVIFITAYPERLLTGERPEPTFLITKPFDPDTLAVSIAQALATADRPSG